ncbi:C3 and PZP-like alpha-2-macroglobulin domain-containing protein 8 isoform X2 [Daphnia pulex]|uniref:C3 and PZP-like alpha-2-macroglobulin domain-containing protein 8 isoform X2 n=1 Tax=Daphnia pulex TaxID=6669 RepID=UPI001EDFCDCF|nr:C3 and PZP-like alpha-2-macroglobulin domain-containing protein 8 isoform X2 [Daphnia pulex]
MKASLLLQSAFVTVLVGLLTLERFLDAAALTQPPAFSPNSTSPSSTWNVVWPRAVILGSTTVMWIDLEGSQQTTNAIVTVRLADSRRTYEQKTLTLHHGEAISPVELTIPMSYDGQLTVRLGCGSPANASSSGNGSNVVGGGGCQSEEFPVHPLEAIQSLSLRLERTVYHPDDVVSIWLACLDQHGQIIAGADPERGPSRTEQAAAMHDVASSVQVAAHDPNNVIVHYWSVSLVGSGLKNLLFQLSDLPQQTGMWTIRATAGGLTAAQSFRLIRRQHQSRQQMDRNATEPEEKPIDPSPMVESHFVELDFSPRTASVIQQGSPFAGELIAGTSERGITVGLDVLDQHGASLHHQTIHFNRTTSTIIFTVPALSNLTSNATLQGTLKSIEGQPLDSQFVLASHSLGVSTWPESGDSSGNCNVQLFSQNGKYRFMEGETLHLSIYSGCKLVGNRINYAVISRSSGHVISWGQEYLVAMTAGSIVQTGNQSEGGDESKWAAELNLSIPVIYEMIPRAIVTVFFSHDDGQHLASSSLDVQVYNNVETKVTVVGVKGNKVRVNMTLKLGSYHCLFGSWADKEMANSAEVQSPNLLGPSIETDRFLRLLPKFQAPPTPWQLFGQSSELWFVQCFDPSESTTKEMDLVVASGSDPQLTLLTVDRNGRVRQSSPVTIPIKPVDWTIDFQLPESVRVGEELVVDVTLTNRFQNCSQTQLQMALTGGAGFVANGKKYLQQPACLAPKSRAVYRVGILVNELSPLVTLTVQLKGSSSGACCAPSQVINLDVHLEQMETLPVSKSVRVSSTEFQHSQSDSYLFCLEENVFVSNASSFKYEVLPLGSHVKTIVFQASAPADLRVVLGSSDKFDDDEAISYHLVMGGEDNMYSWISKQMNGLSEIKTKIATPKILRQDRLQTFWISWDQIKLGRKKRNKPSIPLADQNRWLLSFGKGSHIGVRPLASIPLEAGDTPFRYIGFSTSWGFRGFFRVWGADGAIDQTTRTLSVPKPVPGRVNEEQAEITVKGGIASSLDDMWSATGSTDPSTLVTVLERFHHNQYAKKPAGKEDTSWNGILQNILSFRSADGSFHDADGPSDLRLTALTVHALSSITLQRYSDPDLLKSVLTWMHGQQNDDGSFADGPNVTQRQRIETTAFILTCLSDVQHDDIVLFQVSSAAQRFLERELAASREMKTIVPIATAVLVSHSSAWPETLAKLDSVYDELIDCYLNDRKQCLNEMTYALTAYSHQNKPGKVLEMVRILVSAPWHILHPLDKLRMMKAWSKYSQVLNDPVRNLNMRLTFQNGEVTLIQSHHLSNESALGNASTPPQMDYDDENVIAGTSDNETRSESQEEQQNVRMHTPALTYDIPSLPQNVEVTLSGTGCAIIQTKVYWKTVEPPIVDGSLLSLYTSVESAGLDENEEPPMALNATICVHWNGTSSTDLKIRLEMFSSYVVSSLDAEDNSSEIGFKKLPNGEVVVDIAQVNPNCGRCFRLRAGRTGLVRNIQPGRIDLWEKNRPQFHHHWLLHGPDNSTLWAGTRSSIDHSNKWLAAKPQTCSS